MRHFRNTPSGDQIRRYQDGECEEVMSVEPHVADSFVMADITKALAQANGGDVITALTPVVRRYYCEGFMVGFKAGQEDEQSKHNGTYNQGK